MSHKLDEQTLRKAILTRYAETGQAVTIAEITQATGRSVSCIRKRLGDLPGSTPAGLQRVRVKRQANTFGGRPRYKPVIAYLPAQSTSAPRRPT